jgi:hypothetical protein
VKAPDQRQDRAGNAGERSQSPAQSLSLSLRMFRMRAKKMSIPRLPPHDTAFLEWSATSSAERAESVRRIAEGWRRTRNLRSWMPLTAERQSRSLRLTSGWRRVPFATTRALCWSRRATRRHRARTSTSPSVSRRDSRADHAVQPSPPNEWPGSLRSHWSPYSANSVHRKRAHRQKHHEGRRQHGVKNGRDSNRRGRRGPPHRVAFRSEQ